MSLLIFAGGRATRLGGVNKALLDVGGRAILHRLLDEVGPLADEHLLLANDPALAGAVQGPRVVFDPAPHAGVLPALAAGLEAARGDVCLAVACDMPFASAAVFERMLVLREQHSADVVIPRSGTHLEPMHAVYRRATVLAAIRAALARGERRMVAYFDAVRVVEAGPEALRGIPTDALAHFSFNVNTPEELAEARRLAAGPASIQDG